MKCNAWENENDIVSCYCTRSFNDSKFSFLGEITVKKAICSRNLRLGNNGESPEMGTQNSELKRALRRGKIDVHLRSCVVRALHFDQTIIIALHRTLKSNMPMKPPLFQFSSCWEHESGALSYNVWPRIEKAHLLRDSHDGVSQKDTLH